MKAIKLCSFCRLKKDIMRRGNKDLDYGLGDLVIWENKMISTVIIQVCNQRKQMASVCYHSFYRRQRLRSRWCWLLVPSGCWMWLGKEWTTTKTTASCTAKVTARAFHSRFGGIETWALQNSPEWAGRGVQSKMGSSLPFPLMHLPNLYFQQRLPDCFFFFSPCSA